MKKSELKYLINEVIDEVEASQLEAELAEAFEHDLKRLEETLIAEGFGDIWNKIKQKGSEMAQGAKNALLKPLLKLIVDKIAKSDPQGMAKLANAAKNNPKAIANLMNNPQIQAKQKEVSQELKSINEILTEDEHEELFQEYVDVVLKEAGAKRVRKPRAPKAAEPAPAPESPAAPEAKPKKRKASPKKEKKPQGLIQKVYGFFKEHPKISAVAGVALLGIVIAAAIGSGGVIPLLTSTLSSAASGALSGSAIGGVVSGGKEAASQYFKNKKIDWKKVGTATGQGMVTGAKYGAVAGATGNIAGKAIAGVGKMANAVGNAFGGSKAATSTMKGDPFQNAHRTQRSLHSVDNYMKVGGERVFPGQPLSQRQLGAMKIAMDMGNDGYKLYGPDLMKQYNAAMRR